jgi:hypothetical protein
MAGTRQNFSRAGTPFADQGASLNFLKGEFGGGNKSYPSAHIARVTRRYLYRLQARSIKEFGKNFKAKPWLRRQNTGLRSQKTPRPIAWMAAPPRRAASGGRGGLAAERQRAFGSSPQKEHASLIKN